MVVDPTLAMAGVAVVGIAVAAVPAITDALDRRARRNAAIDLMDLAQKFDFARDTIYGEESTEKKKE